MKNLKLSSLKAKTLEEAYSSGLPFTFGTMSSAVLVPIGPWALTSELVERMCEWRQVNTESFFARFPSSIESTKKYLSKYSLGESNRLLFAIQYERRFVGHIGLSGATESRATLDNVLRGEAVEERGLMSGALETLCAWALTELGIQELDLKVLSSNTVALGFYKRASFFESEVIPLNSVHSNGFTSLIEAHHGIGDSSETCIVMRRFLTN